MDPEAFDEISTCSSTVFLRHVVAAFPYAIACVRTDNGPEFTNRLNSSGTAKLTLFEKTLAESGIRHKSIRPYTPRHKDKAKRRYRKDNEAFYASDMFFSFSDFRTHLAGRRRQYNDFPIRPLNRISPKQALLNFPLSVTHH